MDTVKILLAKGADVHAKADNGLTNALIYASENDYTRIVKLLKDAGAKGPVSIGGPELISEAEKSTDENAGDKYDSAALLRTVIIAEEKNDPEILVEGNNTFAVNLYNRLKIQDGNLFFSPYSISTLLAMTYAGARGNTEKQIAETLSFPFNREQLHPVFANIAKELSRDNKIELIVANGLFAQKDYVFLKEYLELSKMYYDVEMSNVDFRDNSELARLKINKWVEDKTKYRIKRLILPGMINSDTKLVLTNAVYFKADWMQKFQKLFTKDTPFKLLSGKTVLVKMMFREGEYKYGENNSLQILELPYKGKNVSMIILLSKKDIGLIEVEKKLYIAEIEKWIKGMKKTDMEIFMPKFKINSEFNLSQVLILMGMIDAFSSNKADFSGIADFSKTDKKNNLFIKDVIHKAFIDVNEKGTVAAVATYLNLGDGAVNRTSTVFRADHPFIFLIRDNGSGSILFLGRVTDPGAYID